MAIRPVAIYEISKQVKAIDGAYVDIAEIKRHDPQALLQDAGNERVVLHREPVQHLRTARGKDEYIALGPRIYGLLLSASEARAGEELLRERRAHQETREVKRRLATNLSLSAADVTQARSLLDSRNRRIDSFKAAPLWRRLYIALRNTL